MDYNKFEKALEVLDITTRFTHSELKNRYKKLSKLHHPDMQDGNDAKFREINEAYKLLDEYMKNFRYSLDYDEFVKQQPYMGFGIWDLT